MIPDPPAELSPNPYGYFDTAAREYVITRPDTPTPWINYLGEGRYGGIISNTAGGYSFDRDPKNRRVTRYRYNGIPPTSRGATSTCATRKPANIGARPGSRSRPASWKGMNAGMGPPTRASAAATRPSPPSCCILSRREHLARSGS